VLRPTDERSLRIRLLASLAGAALAVGFAFAAAHYYSAPNANGAAHGSPWLETDFCLALSSSLLAFGVGLYAGRGSAWRSVFGAGLVRALGWLFLTIVLALVWGSSIGLLTLLVAPSHSFAGVCLVALGRAWRTEQLFRK
jgi:hypothetical protein